ncbi:MAG TPA: rod shape-determining protein RodA [Gammaproteobacteria bacterium]|jgi:rod shape determining protein RodA|nr:rod shape-determining protein RodA [Gammaproteobacteria bacterium]
MRAESRSHLDAPLMVFLIMLCLSSLFILYSATGENDGAMLRQVIRILLSFAVLAVVAQISPQTWHRWSPWVYIIGSTLLVGVLILGIVGKGAQRWLDLGFFRFQPSELMKLWVPMMVAWVVSRRPLPLSIPMTCLVLIVVMLPVGLVLLQPDLGTAILIAVSGLVIVILAGLRWRYMLGALICVAVAAPYLWTYLHEYQQRRILTLIDPWSDPLGAGYHTIQSMIAIGSGGSRGKGWMAGSQSQLEFIPERSTDFIFSVFAEEFGLMGVGALLAIYMCIVFRALMIAYAAQDTWSRLLAGSLSLTFFFYVFVNIGMVSGMLPVVGVPLPLISYGGTSMVTLMFGFGILMSIHSHQSLMNH